MILFAAIDRYSTSSEKASFYNEVKLILTQFMKYYLLASILILPKVCLSQTNIFPATGSAGIGTMSPKAGLDIESATTWLTNSWKRSLILGGTGNGSSAALQFGFGEGRRWGLGSSAGNFYIWTATADDISASAIYRMMIDSNGKIGIGTNAPQSTLSVNGDITAKKLTVLQTGWPDYVFDDDHVLISLDSIQTYISKHHGLPDIPSEQEINSHGLDMGYLLKKQMQKIEELTLYVIRQQHEIDSLKAFIYGQSNKMLSKK